MKFSFAEVDKLENFTFNFTSNITVYPGKSVVALLPFDPNIIINIISWNTTRWFTSEENSYVQDLADCSLRHTSDIGDHLCCGVLSIQPHI